MKFSFIYWESFYDIRTDFHHDFDASGTSNAMFDELAERPLMTPLAGTKHTYVKVAIVKFSHFVLCFVNKKYLVCIRF